MRGGDLTTKQLATIRASLRPKIDYLAALRSRMEQRSFPDSDRLYRAVRLSHEHLRELLLEIETQLNYRGFHSELQTDLDGIF